MPKISRVSVEKIKNGLSTLYSYYVPVEISNLIQVGSRVRVPFGKNNSLRNAYVIELDDTEDVLDNFKFIDSLVDNEPLLKSREVLVSRWISETCCCDLFSALNAFLPVQIRKKGFNDDDSELFVEDFKFRDIELSKLQQGVFDKLSDWFYHSQVNESLLYGITGSGKTSVFLKVAQKVLSEGKNVAILIPEISLIPQTLSIIEKFFGKNTFACIHSGLSPKKRALEWYKIRKGFAKLVVGTRSAILSPFEKLDLIIIDEEQESTYKSDSNPRFHARNVAQFLCKRFGSKLLLASATPSVESFYYAKSGKKLLFEMKERYGDSCLPSVQVVNIRRNIMNVESFLSDELINLIDKTVNEGKQVILLLDRRGFHTIVKCVSCGTPIMCENCNLTLSHHLINGRDKLICHYCGFSEDIPKLCAQCGSDKIFLSGVGTQNLESEISSIIKNAKCLRVDADTTTSKKAYEKMFKDFREKKFNVMIGTRMVAKGLDFGDVKLVGVICADQALFGEEYKAYERMFTLISQVVGRSGRKGRDGVALIQTFSSDNPVIEIASKQDYDAFFESEISLRKSMLYPPFVDICLIGFVGADENDTQKACQLFFEILRETITQEFSNIPIKVLAPTSAFLKKAFNKFRFKIIIKCINNMTFRKFILTSFEKYKNTKGKNGIFISCSKKSKVNSFIDFNPETIF